MRRSPRRTAVGELRDQLEAALRLRRHRVGVADRRRAGRQEVRERRTGRAVARRPLPRPRRRRPRLVRGGSLRDRSLAGDLLGGRLDHEPARQVGRRLAAGEAHEARVGDLRVEWLAQGVVPAAGLDDLDGVDGSVLVSLVDDATARGGDHGRPISLSGAVQ
jgi:hypothetical protein